MSTRRLHALRDANGRTGCAQAAIAAVTGVPLAEIQRSTGKGSLKPIEVMAAVYRLGLRCEIDFRMTNRGLPWWRRLRKPTLGTWLQEGYDRDGAAHLLLLKIRKAHHVVAVADGEIMDNGAMIDTVPVPIGPGHMLSKARLARNVWLRIPPGEESPEGEIRDRETPEDADRDSATPGARPIRSDDDLPAGMREYVSRLRKELHDRKHPGRTPGKPR